MNCKSLHKSQAVKNAVNFISHTKIRNKSYELFHYFRAIYVRDKMILSEGLLAKKSKFWKNSMVDFDGKFYGRFSRKNSMVYFDRKIIWAIFTEKFYGRF